MKRIIIYSVIAGGILIIFSLVFLRAYLSEFLVLGIMVGVVPYSILTYLEHKKIGEMEANFPIFLRDLAEAKRSGMTLPQAIKNASKKDYGALSREVKKMANQLSWGIPFPEVIHRFLERVRESDFMKRGIGIVSEAFRSGGNIAKVIYSVSDSADAIKEAEEEIKSKMYKHIMVMYVIYFLFIGIVIVIMNIMKPLIEFQKGAGAAIFGGAGGLSMEYYRGLFRNMLIVMGFFNGIIAGQVGEGSIRAGIKHSLIMVTTSILVSLTVLS